MMSPVITSVTEITTTVAERTVTEYYGSLTTLTDPRHHSPLMMLILSNTGHTASITNVVPASGITTRSSPLTKLGTTRLGRTRHGDQAASGSSSVLY